MEARQDMRAKGQLKSCPHSCAHACIHSMTQPCKYSAGMYSVPGTVLLPNSFDLFRNQDGDGSERENWEPPFMLNPPAEAPLLGPRFESSDSSLACFHLYLLPIPSVAYYSFSCATLYTKESPV